MEEIQTKKRNIIGLLSGILLMSLLTSIVVSPIPASARSFAKMHFAIGVKFHPLATPYHGVFTRGEKCLGIESSQALNVDAPMNEVTSPQKHSPYTNMMPMLIFSVGLVLLIVFGFLQKHELRYEDKRPKR